MAAMTMDYLACPACRSRGRLASPNSLAAALHDEPCLPCINDRFAGKNDLGNAWITVTWLKPGPMAELSIHARG